MTDKIIQILKSRVTNAFDDCGNSINVISADEITDLAADLNTAFEERLRPAEEDIRAYIESTKREDGSPSMDEQAFYEGAKWFRSRMGGSK